MQMLCALFSFIKMIKQQWASWARTQQRNKQGPGQALLFVNTNIHDNSPQFAAAPPHLRWSWCWPRPSLWCGCAGVQPAAGRGSSSAGPPHCFLSISGTLAPDL